MALNHEQPDRPPIEIGGLVTSPTYGAYENMKKYFQLKNPKATIGGFKVMLNIDDEILERCHTDFRTHYFSVKGEAWKDHWIAEDKFIDRWGVTFRDVGDYYEMIKYPFEGEITVDDVLNYPWPDFSDPSMYTGVREEVKKLYDTGSSIIGTVNCNIMERAMWLRGLQDFLTDMLADEDVAAALLDQTTKMILDYLENYLPLVSDYIDVMSYGDDLATQESLLFSPETYRKLVKPRQAKVFRYIKEHSHAKIFYHCCGSAIRMLDDMIDAGVDILNPVQPCAKGMDFEFLKKRYGKELTFWGAIDEQHLLPHGTPEEVKSYTENAIRILGEGGGYVCAPAHNIQSDVPMENLLAMCDACANYKA